MLLEDLPTELINTVFFSCTSVPDVLHLSSTCRRFRKIYQASQKLPILSHAIDAEFGPIDDVIQLVTHNDSQPAQVRRQVPWSMALLAQILKIGRVARKWEMLYPLKKWKVNFEDRRLLSAEECFRLRRAIYRLWLYDRAFHNPRNSRYTRLMRPLMLERAALLHNWTTAELLEIEDIRGVIRDVLENNICPSNGTIQRKFRKRFPEPEAQQQLMFNIHLNYPPPTAFQQHFHTTHQVTASDRFLNKFLPTPQHEPGAEGWGDEIPHYYVVQDMMKLDPGQIMWLKENAPLKGQVEGFVRGLGDWFDNNGETFGQTLDWVLNERGVNAQELKESIGLGQAGITKSLVGRILPMDGQ
ncbi:MAG: hypothetical protein M1823_003423 [Watsoniomyces obsoletus]|nr:MAG: hypothetical protein M1823_003423 [Watsoniomyces obsoletus]